MFVESFFLSFYTVLVVPKCSPDLKHVVGQKFQSLDFGFAFYDVYARAVGFDTRKQGMRKTDGVTTWYSVVCNREGSKKSSEGHASSSASRLISKREKAIKKAKRPLRQCKACYEMGHHDSRNCPMLKEMAKEKELCKGKRKS